MTISAVSAAENTTDVTLEEVQDEFILQETVNEDEIISADEITDANATEDVEVTVTSEDTNIVSGKYFSVNVKTDNGTPVAKKPVYFTINGVTSKSNTNANGVAKLLITQKEGSYTVKYSFNETGYTSVKNSTKILVISTKTSKIKGSNSDAYVGFINKYTVTLTVGGVNLAGREVKFTINGKSYTSKTNSKGVATLKVNLKKGTYKVKYSYKGEQNIKSASGSAKIKMIKGMPTKITKYGSQIYRDKTSAPFKVKLVNVYGNAMTNKKIKFTYNGKTYTKTTDSKGIATVNINLSKGYYNVKYTFSKTSKYNKATKTTKITVKSNNVRNNGYWVWSTHMNSVNFDYMKKIGTKHIFLNAKAVTAHGKTAVENFITNAHSHGIKVHLWMQVFYKDGKWQYPVSKNGKYKTSLINSKVKLAKSYAKIKGVDGIHFDYLRFPGNAYKYKNAAAAVNMFTKKASSEIHKINSSITVSAALMPEPSSMKYYYGQDYKTLTKYLDVVVPMIYKGNYNAGTSWILKITNTFVKQSSHAQVWSGIQTYKSDSNTAKLTSSQLMADADAAGLGGAQGVILFRFGLVNDINFSNV